MKQPFSPIGNEPIKAWHLRSHAEAIQYLLATKQDKKTDWYIDNGSSQSLGYTPWSPNFFTTGTAPSLVYKCTFNLGTVNQVIAGNWNDEFTLPSDDTIKFVVLTITTASGEVTGVSISIDSSAPADDTIAKDTPPVSFKIVLGAIGKNTAKMIIAANIQVIANEVFRESIATPATGAEPFSRWWRWTIQ